MIERRQEVTIPNDILAGVYQHYKGEYYLVLGLGRHSETDEKFVVYVPLYVREGPRIALRPAELFFDEVEIEGVKKPRFSYISADLPDTFQQK